MYANVDREEKESMMADKYSPVKLFRLVSGLQLMLIKFGELDFFILVC